MGGSVVQNGAGGAAACVCGQGVGAGGAAACALPAQDRAHRCGQGLPACTCCLFVCGGILLSPAPQCAALPPNKTAVGQGGRLPNTAPRRRRAAVLPMPVQPAMLVQPTNQPCLPAGIMVYGNGYFGVTEANYAVVTLHLWGWLMG